MCERDLLICLAKRAFALHAKQVHAGEKEAQQLHAKSTLCDARVRLCDGIQVVESARQLITKIRQQPARAAASQRCRRVQPAPLSPGGACALGMFHILIKREEKANELSGGT